MKKMFSKDCSHKEYLEKWINWQLNFTNGLVRLKSIENNCENNDVKMLITFEFKDTSDYFSIPCYFSLDEMEAHLLKQNNDILWVYKDDRLMINSKLILHTLERFVFIKR